MREEHRGLYGALNNRVIYCKPHARLQIWIQPDFRNQATCKVEILYSPDEIIVAKMTSANDDKEILKAVDAWLDDALRQYGQALQVLQDPNQNWTDGAYRKRPCHFLRLSKHLRIALTDKSDSVPWYHDLYLLGKSNKVLAEPLLITEREPLDDTKRRVRPLIEDYIRTVQPIYQETRDNLFGNSPPICAR